MEARALARVYRPDPTPAQRVALARRTGCRRYVCNWGPARRREHYAATGQHRPAAALSAAPTALKRRPATAWLAEVDGRALQRALRGRDRAYANRFAGWARRPRFASKHRGDRAARLPQRAGVDGAARAVRPPRVGAARARLSRPPAGAVQSATVRGDACGDWWVSRRLAAPTPVEAPVPGDVALADAVGLDPGLTTYATRSTGEAFASPRHLRPRQRALARAQRSLARERKGGKDRDTARKRVARLHREVARRRADFRHRLTTRLARGHDPLCAEDLNIAGLARTEPARSFADAAHGEPPRQVHYKAEWRGEHVVAVGRPSPSSTACGACGHAHAGLARKDRAWTCPACGTVHDRDAAAAGNILAEGSRPSALRHAGRDAGGAPRTVAAGSPETRNARGRRIRRSHERGAG
jgi:putative transposase